MRPALTGRSVLIVSLVAMFALGVLVQRSGLIDQIAKYRADIVFLSQQHIKLVAISGGLAVIMGVPLGLWLSRPRMRSVAESIMQVLNIGSTVPTLAVLALAMSLLGIGTVPAIFALWLASLLPIVRNTYAGMLGVPAHVIEAANGMGMRPMQILRGIELPNALFVSFAGIRTALAINVGTAPLAFLIGGGGLGELIFTGIDLNEPGMMLAGAIPTALLAAFVDYAVGALAYWVVPRGVNPLR
ncbi:MAG: ABC transporter permease [Pseudomonadota bacterium]|nr:ABC transporter permease [Pseudomonadota bacterium]